MNKAFKKSRIAMSAHVARIPLVSVFWGSDVVGSIRGNDAIGYERSNFSKNQDYKSFLRVAVNPYVHI